MLQLKTVMLCFEGGTIEMITVRVSDIHKQFLWDVVTDKSSLNRIVTTAEISRPGIELTGYFKNYAKERIQVIGEAEIKYFMQLSADEQQERTEKICDSNTPAIIFTKNIQVPKKFYQIANTLGIPILRTYEQTSKVIGLLTAFLESMFAPRTSVHGVLVDIHGLGVLIKGKSGVGKSETALELIQRGHRLVADDRVEIRSEEEELVGFSPPLIKHLIEIRGLGIIDVLSLFGASSVVKEKEIALVINIETWEDKKQYERIGEEYTSEKILEINVPHLTIPIRSGRSLATIIEVAVMNYRLKKSGFNAASEFTNRLADELKSNQLKSGEGETI